MFGFLKKEPLNHVQANALEQHKDIAYNVMQKLDKAGLLSEAGVLIESTLSLDTHLSTDIELGLSVGGMYCIQRTRHGYEFKKVD